MDILPIQQLVERGEIFFTDHAVRQMAKRDIDDGEVAEVILSGEIIEEYPDDKYSPSCLIFGQTNNQRPFTHSLFVTASSQGHYRLRTRS